MDWTGGCGLRWYLLVLYLGLTAPTAIVPKPPTALFNLSQHLKTSVIITKFARPMMRYSDRRSHHQSQVHSPQSTVHRPQLEAMS